MICIYSIHFGIAEKSQVCLTGNKSWKCNSIEKGRWMHTKQALLMPISLISVANTSIRISSSRTAIWCMTLLLLFFLSLFSCCWEATHCLNALSSYILRVASLFCGFSNRKQAAWYVQYAWRVRERESDRGR